MPAKRKPKARKPSNLQRIGRLRPRLSEAEEIKFGLQKMKPAHAQALVHQNRFKYKSTAQCLRLLESRTGFLAGAIKKSRADLPRMTLQGEFFSVARIYLVTCVIEEAGRHAMIGAMLRAHQEHPRFPEKRREMVRIAANLLQAARNNGFAAEAILRRLLKDEL